MTSESRDDALERQIQPHLPTPPVDPVDADDSSRVMLGEEGVSISMQAPADRSTWVQFDDDNDEGNRPAQSANVQATPDVGSHQPTGGTTSQSQSSASGYTSFPHPASSETTGSPPEVLVMGDPRAIYNAQSGEAEVRVPGKVSTTSSATLPQPVIVTNQMFYERERERERPLTARRMMVLKILSVVVAVLFFPTGLPAAYYAWRTPREFNEGIQRGNIDRAQKFAQRAERLIILSVIGVILVVVLAIAIVERAKNGPNTSHQYIAHG